MRVKESDHRSCAERSVLARNDLHRRSRLSGFIIILTALALATPASGLAAAPSVEQPAKWCVDNYKTKKVTCAATLETAEALNGVNSASARGAGVAPESTLQDYISYVLWNDYNYTGSGYFLYNYPCYGGSSGWNNLVDWQDQTRSAQPITCTEITLYAYFNLYKNYNGPTYCYTYGGNVTYSGTPGNGYGKSFSMGDPPGPPAFPSAPYCG